MQQLRYYTSILISFSLLQLLGLMLHLPSSATLSAVVPLLNKLTSWVAILTEACGEEVGDELRMGCASSIVQSGVCSIFIRILNECMSTRRNHSETESVLRLSTLATRLFLSLMRLLQVGCFHIFYPSLCLVCLLQDDDDAVRITANEAVAASMPLPANASNIQDKFLFVQVEFMANANYCLTLY
jgi:hypothetical protein